MLDSTGGARWQQRRKEEVIPRGDDNDVVILGIKLLEERDGAPSSAFLVSVSKS
jgi:hypothetical protein